MPTPDSGGTKDIVTSSVREVGGRKQRVAFYGSVVGDRYAPFVATLDAETGEVIKAGFEGDPTAGKVEDVEKVLNGCVKSVTVTWGKSSSPSVKPSAFAQDAPSVNWGEYLWQRTHVVLVDGTDSTHDACVSGPSAIEASGAVKRTVGASGELVLGCEAGEGLSETSSGMALDKSKLPVRAVGSGLNLSNGTVSVDADSLQAMLPVDVPVSSSAGSVKCSRIGSGFGSLCTVRLTAAADMPSGTKVSVTGIGKGLLIGTDGDISVTIYPLGHEVTLTAQLKKNDSATWSFVSI